MCWNVASRQEQEQQEEQQDAKSEVKRVEEAMADWLISTPSLFFSSVPAPVHLLYPCCPYYLLLLSLSYSSCLLLLLPDPAPVPPHF